MAAFNFVKILRRVIYKLPNCVERAVNLPMIAIESFGGWFCHIDVETLLSTALKFGLALLLRDSNCLHFKLSLLNGSKI